MTSLLQSKVFKRNLIRWIGMYACIMMFTVTIVTYSRYVSRISSNDNARVASFNIKVLYDDSYNCVAEIVDGKYKVCEVNEVRPTSAISYNFTVDATKLEVRTRLFLVITVDPSTINPFSPDFKFYSLERWDPELGYYVEVDTSEFTVENNKIKLDYIIEPSSAMKAKYRVTVKYNADKLEDDGDGIKYYSGEEIKVNDLVAVSYIATQEPNSGNGSV